MFTKNSQFLLQPNKAHFSAVIQTKERASFLAQQNASFFGEQGQVIINVYIGMTILDNDKCHRDKKPDEVIGSSFWGDSS